MLLYVVDGDGVGDDFNRVGPQDTFPDLGWLSLVWKIIINDS